MSDNPMPKLYAEAVATFALTFVGAGAIWVGGGAEADLLTVAVAHGIILSVMVTATMNISEPTSIQPLRLDSWLQSVLTQSWVHNTLPHNWQVLFLRAVSFTRLAPEALGLLHQVHSLGKMVPS